jgi:hypothetical protein
VSTRDLDSPPQPTTELPPFIFVPDHGGTPAPSDPPVAAEAPAVGDPAPRRWSTRHTVAAAAVAVGVLVSGGAGWVAHDATGPASVGPAAGQLPGGAGGFDQLPGQLPGTLPGQAPDGTPDDDGAADT